VFDRFAPAEAPSRPVLIVGTPDAVWLRKPSGSVTKPRFESWVESHPVMQHVSLYDVSIETAARIDAADATVLGGFGNETPLILAWENPKRIQLAFDLQSSDLPYHAAFPVFLDNVIAWYGRERLALRRSPGPVEIPFSKADVRTIDGRPVPTQESVNGTVFEADDPGLYVASTENIRQYIAVNFSSRDFSNINNSRLRTGASTETASVPFLRRELWFYMLSLALLLVGAEWFTYHRRITL